MIDFIFTLDYEIYGDGTGSLKDLVYEPAAQLREIFLQHNARFVAFVEAAELERIEEAGSDPAAGAVKTQIRQFHREGFEIGLHLHPQWANARYEAGRWNLDYSEYNLCNLPESRIERIVAGALDYLRSAVAQPAFAPLAFRAGNWLFQPTKIAAAVLARHGIKIDSSVFKGGVQHQHGLDYRPALKNGFHWRFRSDVNRAEAGGELLEIPIYSRLVPAWKMATSKRLGFKNSPARRRSPGTSRFNRLRDLARLKYPLKLDFCRMTLSELTSMMSKVIQEDRESPELYKPVVAIGHTKDLMDSPAVEGFLAFLRAQRVQVGTFETAYATRFDREQAAVTPE